MMALSTFRLKCTKRPGQNGKSWNDITLAVKVHGSDEKLVHFIPKGGKSVVGYDALDLVFDQTGKNPTFLEISHEVMNNDGRNTYYDAYNAVLRMNGHTYSCPVQPETASDRAILNMFLEDQGEVSSPDTSK